MRKQKSKRRSSTRKNATQQKRKINGDLTAASQFYGWASATEVLDFCDALFTDDELKENRAIAKCAIWKRRMRNKLPTEFEVTCDLVRARQLFRQCRAQKGTNSKVCSPKVDEHVVVSVSSLAIVRCTNLVSSRRASTAWLRVGDADVDVAKASSGERTYKKMRVEAKHAGLPSWIVEVRHAAAHREKPSISILEKATHYLLEWLHKSYWIRLRDSLMQNVTCAVQLEAVQPDSAMDEILTQLFDASYRQDVNAVKMQVEALSELLSSSQYNADQRTALFEGLVNTSLAQAAEHTTEKLNLIVVWRPVFELLFERYELCALIELTLLGLQCGGAPNSCANRMAVLREIGSGLLQFVAKCAACGALELQETAWRLCVGRVLNHLTTCALDRNTLNLVELALALRTPALTDSKRANLMAILEQSLPAGHIQSVGTRREPKHEDCSTADWSVDTSWITGGFSWADYPLGACRNYNPVHQFLQITTSSPDSHEDSVDSETDADVDSALDAHIEDDWNVEHELSPLESNIEFAQLNGAKHPSALRVSEHELLSMLSSSVAVLT